MSLLLRPCVALTLIDLIYIVDYQYRSITWKKEQVIYTKKLLKEICEERLFC